MQKCPQPVSSSHDLLRSGSPKTSRLQLEGGFRSNTDGSDSAGSIWEALDPSTVVELGVVLLDQALVVDDHVVDAVDWIWLLGGGGDLPSPGDVLASVPDVQSVDLNLRLVEPLAGIEGSLVGESNGSKLG